MVVVAADDEELHFLPDVDTEEMMLDVLGMDDVEVRTCHFDACCSYPVLVLLRSKLDHEELEELLAVDTEVMEVMMVDCSEVICIVVMCMVWCKQVVLVVSSPQSCSMMDFYEVYAEHWTVMESSQDFSWVRRSHCDQTVLVLQETEVLTSSCAHHPENGFPSHSDT